MRYKLSHLLIMGLIVTLISSWFTVTVMSQTPEEKAFNRTVFIRSGPGDCTGVILQTNLVMTAAHCVIDEKTTTVDGKKATVLKIDESADLALLLAETVITERIRVADVSVGDDVFTWGYPFASPNRVYSRGYISVIQFNSTFSTNVAVPGQSGSGLFDRQGNLVGIITRYMGGTGFSVNRTPDQIREFWKL